jgi:hypothetical protein
MDLSLRMLQHPWFTACQTGLLPHCPCYSTMHACAKLLTRYMFWQYINSRNVNTPRVLFIWRKMLLSLQLSILSVVLVYWFHLCHTICILFLDLRSLDRQSGRLILCCSATWNYRCAVVLLIQVENLLFYFFTLYLFYFPFTNQMGAAVAQAVYCLTTGWTIGRSRFDPRQGQRIFLLALRPDRLWGPPSLLSNGYRGFFPLG